MKSLGRRNYFCFSVTQSCLTLQPHGLQHTRLPCPSPSPRTCSNSYPLSQWCHPISSSVTPFPAFNLSQHQALFYWICSSYQVVKLLEIQLQHQSFQWILRTDFVRIDWFDILVVQGTLKNLLQHRNSKPSIHRQSPFFNPLQCSCLENAMDGGAL